MLGSFGDVGELFLGAALEMTVITDGTDTYLNAPFFGALLEQGGGAEIADQPGLGWFGIVADGWGRIDAAALVGSDIDVMEQLENFSGLQGGGAEEVENSAAAFAEHDHASRDPRELGSRSQRICDQVPEIGVLPWALASTPSPCFFCNVSSVFRL